MLSRSKTLLPTLRNAGKQTGDVRIVFESSVGFRWTPSGGLRLDELKTTQDHWLAGRWVRYGQSKLANVVYASELARCYAEITSMSVHPGVIDTNLWTVNRSLLNGILEKFATLGQSITVEKGSHTPCWAMTAPKEKLAISAFREGAGAVGSPSKVSSNKILGESVGTWTQDLWSWTQNELEVYGN